MEKSKVLRTWSASEKKNWIVNVQRNRDVEKRDSDTRVGETIWADYNESEQD